MIDALYVSVILNKPKQVFSVCSVIKEQKCYFWKKGIWGGEIGAKCGPS